MNAPTFRSLNEALFSAGPIVEFEGRHFITFGNPGFNSRPNNRRGWATHRGAWNELERYRTTPRNTALDSYIGPR